MSCTIISKGPWIAKNEEGTKKKFLMLISKPDLPYEWSYILVPPSKSIIDLNEVISQNIAENKLQKIEVEERTYEKFRDLSDIIPKKILPSGSMILPVVLHRGEKNVSLVSADNFSATWAGMGKITTISTSIHHQDRGSFLTQGRLQSAILSEKFPKALEEVKKYLKRYNMAGFNIIFSDNKRKAVVSNLYERKSIVQAKKNLKGPDLKYTFSKMFKMLFEPKTVLDYNELVVRTNFSPILGYWNLGWKPNDDVKRRVKLTRNLNRYLRAYELFSEIEEMNFQSILEVMTDHGHYTGIFRNIEKIYRLVMNSNPEEALKSVRKLVEKPSYFTICTHPSVTKLGPSQKETKFNFIANVEERKLQVVFGNPCKKENILRFNLKEFG